MNNNEKVLAIVEINPDGINDEDVRAQADFKTKNQANVVLNNLAKDGRILRYRPDGEKVLMNFPLSKVDEVERNNLLLSYISQQTDKGEEEILSEALNSGVDENSGSLLIDSLASEVAEKTGKTVQTVKLHAITEYASRHGVTNAWKKFLVAKVNSEHKAPSRVLSEALVDFMQQLKPSPVKDEPTGEEDTPHPDGQEQQEQ